MDNAARKMVLKLLDSHRIMTVATNRPDGWPQATTVGYAMCGRLSVGKGFLDAERFGWCGHVFDLLVRRAWPLAIMPFAEPGPDQQHAL